MFGQSKETITRGLRPCRTCETSKTSPGAASRPPQHRAQRRRAVAVEAAVCMPVIVAMMLAMWQIGQMVEMSRIVKDAAREGARVAAGGINNGTPVTVANVQTAVQNFLTAAGMPSTAVNGAMITVTNLSCRFVDQPRQCPAPGPVQRDRDHSRRRGLQQLAVHWGLDLCGVTQLQETVDWLSANDTQLTVSTTLPL